MQWIQYSLDVLDWLHGRPPAQSAREQVSMWNCLHLLTLLLGWSFGAAQQHHMDFSLAQGPSPLRGHATGVPWPTATWIRSYQLWQSPAGNVAASSMSQSHPTPAVPRPLPFIISCLSFLYVSDPYYYWVCIPLSHRSPGLHYLFIIAALKDIHNLRMRGKRRGRRGGRVDATMSAW